jgi:hypothetical protein
MKTCSKCGCEKPLTEFYRAKGNKDGYSGRCKVCQTAENNAWKEANADKMRGYKKKWDENNKDKVAAKTRRWYEANKERKVAMDLARDKLNKEQADARKAKWRQAHRGKANAAGQKWRRNNRDKVNAFKARRKAAELQATPAWAIDFFMEEAYALAKLRTEMFGFEWHVDHIVPLRSKLVCGLHSHDNLRVIPGAENISKGNRHWPDMPC